MERLYFPLGGWGGCIDFETCEISSECLFYSQSYYVAFDTIILSVLSTNFFFTMKF